MLESFLMKIASIREAHERDILHRESELLLG